MSQPLPDRKRWRKWWYRESPVYRAWVNRCWACLFGDQHHRPPRGRNGGNGWTH